MRKECIAVFNVDIEGDQKIYHGMCDLQRPLINAFGGFYVKKIIIHNCLFHYSQALNTNISSKGLKSYHQQNGNKFDFDLYCYFRQYHALALLPPKKIPRAWKLIASKYKDHAPSASHAKVSKWIKYHRNYYMKSGKFIKEWCCYRCQVRTNNLLECRNRLINDKFGTHPHLYAWVQFLAKWYCDGFIEYQQYKLHGFVIKRQKREVLKNKALIKWWTFIDCNDSNNDILKFLKNTSKAMKADVNTLKKMLKEP